MNIKIINQPDEQMGIVKRSQGNAIDSNKKRKIKRRRRKEKRKERERRRKKEEKKKEKKENENEEEENKDEEEENEDAIGHQRYSGFQRFRSECFLRFNSFLKYSMVLLMPAIKATCVAWCGMVWYGVVWCGMVWRGFLSCRVEW